MRLRALAPLVGVLLAACDDAGTIVPGRGGDDGTRANVERVLDAAIERVTGIMDSIDEQLRPVPLLTGAQEAAMRRYRNADHLARARALGVQANDSAQRAQLLASGRLVQLEDSTELWVVRPLQHSIPLVTPDTHRLLTRIGEAFQQRLERLGLPRYRVEVTSVLRTPESQASLRRSNPNAAAGESTHEFGTTLDLSYSSFAAPHDAQLGIDVQGAEWLEPRLNRLASALLETAAARKSRELQSVLGAVLLELQRAGDVLVRLERQQTVYHITVARRQR